MTLVWHLLVVGTLALALSLVLGSSEKLLALVLGFTDGLTRSSLLSKSRVGAAETVGRLNIESIFKRVVDASEASSLTTTELSLEAENEDGLLISLELGGEDRDNLGAGNSSSLGVVHLNHLK